MPYRKAEMALCAAHVASVAVLGTLAVFVSQWWLLVLLSVMLLLDNGVVARSFRALRSRNGARHARRTSRNGRNDPAEACDCPRCEDDHPYL